MSVYQVIKEFQGFDYDGFFEAVRDCDVEACLQKDKLAWRDYLTLLSPQAEKFLEPMAIKANKLTVQYFGKVMQLFTPMYIADYCDNHCLYCGFAAQNDFARTALTMEEIRRESEKIVPTGLQDVLILTGESPEHSSVEYILAAVNVLKEYFQYIAIEVYALTENEYRQMAAAGVEGLTMFQETYNEELYPKLHPMGPKHDYRFRLDAPERGCKAGLHCVGIGALLGLDDWRQDAFLTGLHADYLQRKYPEVEIGISTPRMRPHIGGYPPRSIVDDKNLVQYILAYRLFMPRCGITVSTREAPKMRNSLVRLGVTKMSGSVSVSVGGRTKADDAGQFEISDTRSAGDMAAMLYHQGYQPVYKDWQWW